MSANSKYSHLNDFNNHNRIAMAISELTTINHFSHKNQIKYKLIEGLICDNFIVNHYKLSTY